MKYINEFRKQKANTMDIILYSVILGVIINVISNSLELIINISPWIYLVLGCSVAVLLIMITLIYNICKLNHTIKYNGLFIVDKDKKNKFIKIPNYPISDNMEDYLDAAFSENKAIKHIWEEGEFNQFITTQDKKILVKAGECSLLLLELIEYSLLENLSTFIGDYFNQRHIHDKLIKIDQNSIPDILLNNRFLKLFSENAKNRSAFVERNKSDFEDDHGTVVLMYGKNGAMYRRFDLNLPNGSKIYRSNKNTIIIDTKLFVLTIRVLFGGFSAVVENDFYKYYIKTSNTAFSEYEFNIEVEVKYKMNSIFKVMDWKYYNWLDDYINRLQHYCDINTFYKDIFWEENKTLIRVLDVKPER